VILRTAIAVSVLLVMAGAYFLWKRPPRRLSGLDLSRLGIRGPALVQFTTRYCAPCKASAPHLQEAANRAGIPFLQLDVGERPEVARTYGIRTVPTIAVTGRAGRAVEVWTSLPPDGEIVEAVYRASSSVESA
jgi:thioredoxin 1